MIYESRLDGLISSAAQLFYNWGRTQQATSAARLTEEQAKVQAALYEKAASAPNIDNALKNKELTKKVVGFAAAALATYLLLKG